MCIKNINFGDQRLNEYCFHSGGGMTGGYYSETVKRYDDTHAVIIIEKAEWHNQEPSISTHTTDISIMDELENVIRKHKMYNWKGKKFTDMFVCDGESKGYTFLFDKDIISFSSQIYPQFYRTKLNELDTIIKNHLSD